MADDLKGTSTLLFGEPGTGKTYSLATWVKCGLRLVVLFTDPGGEQSLLQALKDQKLPVDKVHWAYVPPTAPSWEDLKRAAQQVNMMGYQQLAELKAGLVREAYRQFIVLLETLSDFRCERTGERLGAVDSWGPDTVFVLDGLSGINDMALQLHIGAKPVAHQGEWGVAMRMEQQLVAKLTSDLKCFFVLIGHVEMERDELSGTYRKMVSALGRRVAPSLPHRFTDVIYSFKESGKYRWSAVMDDATTKQRSLPAGSVPQDFGLIYRAWTDWSKTAFKEGEA